MKRFLLDTLLFFQVVVGMIQGDLQSEQMIPVSIGETVNLKCQILFSELDSSVWRQANVTIFLGTTLNPDIKKRNKYNLNGNHTTGEYFLKIIGITEADLSSYWCETQTSGEAVQRKITLLLRQYTTNRGGLIQSSLTTQSEKVEEAQTTRSIQETTAPSSENQHSTDPIQVTERIRTTTIVHTSQSIIGSTSVKSYTSVNKKDSTFLSGLAMDEKYLLFGLVGACFVLVLAVSISINICINRKCKTAKIKASTEPTNLQRHQEYRQSTIETSSAYECIDESKLHSDIGPMHSNVPNLPLRTSVSIDPGSTVSSNRSYLEFLEGNVDVYTNPYQSLSDMDNIETPHHYSEVKNIPVPSRTICSPEYEKAHRPNSLLSLRNNNAKIETVHIKRANSWPKEFKIGRKDEGALQKIKHLGRNEAVNNSLEPKNRKSACFSLNIKPSIKNNKNNIDTMNLERVASFDDSIVHLSNINTNLDTKTLGIEPKVITPPIDGATISTSIESLGKNSNNPRKKDNVSSLPCMWDFDSSSDNNSDDLIKRNVSKRENGSYEDLSKNDLDGVHDYNVCSTTLRLNIL